MIRILHVSHTSHRGGAELALARLLAPESPLSQPERSPASHWQAAVSAPPGGSAFAGLAKHGVDVGQDLTPLPGGGTHGRNPVRAARYLLALKANAVRLRKNPAFADADLVHANSAAAGIVCALANRGRVVALVVHLRDQVSPLGLGRVGFELFTRTALHHADAVIANSRFTLESASAYLSPRVARIALQSPSGIAQRVTVPVVHPEVHAVGMVARLQAWKGQHIFLRAFAGAFGGTRVKAYLAGEDLFGQQGYRRRLVDLAARLGLTDQVVFLGHVDDVSTLLDSLDIVVHASTRPEPLGQSVLQGLARAKPVIATVGGGPSEWITSGVNGLLVPPGEPPALEAALRRLARSPAERVRLAMGAAATAGLLTDDECAQAHADFFATLVQSRQAVGQRSG